MITRLMLAVVAFASLAHPEPGMRTLVEQIRKELTR